MVSVIICSIMPTRYAAVCANLGRLLGAEPHEFICINDAASLAEGYNRGIAKSTGDVIICCHDDIEFLADDFWDRISHRLKYFDLLGVAGSTKMIGPAWVEAGPPYIFGQVAHLTPPNTFYDVVVWGNPSPCIPDIRIMDGLFLCGHRKVFETVQFDQDTFRGFHLYDLDFTAEAHRSGFKLAVCVDLMAIHSSPGDFGLKWEQDAQRFRQKHQAVIEHYMPQPWRVMQLTVARRQLLPAILRSPYWQDWRDAGITTLPK